MYHIIDNGKTVAKLYNVADVVEYVFMEEIPLKTLKIQSVRDVELFISILEDGSQDETENGQL